MSGILQYKALNGIRATQQWVVPYVNSMIHKNEFKPILCYLFTDWKCNIDCHYCFQNSDEMPEMDLETAKSSIDWLKSLGCRVVALMGGEPLMRKDFTLEIIQYGTEKGFFTYLPTNGYLMDRSYIDDLGSVGVTAINLAVDCVAPRKGLPKALLNIEPQFRYLIERQKKFGYILFFNINICRNNLKDVKILTEIAHQNRIGTDYHLNEPPKDFITMDHYTHTDNHLSVTKDQYEELDDLLDWLIDKQRQGWPMVNSISHLNTFKHRMRGKVQSWDCRAGRNGVLIRTDGTLSPCFELISHDHDWGRIWSPRFIEKELEEVKKDCLPVCSSTCFHTMGNYYKLQMVPEWVRKHVRVG